MTLRKRIIIVVAKAASAGILGIIYNILTMRINGTYVWEGMIGNWNKIVNNLLIALPAAA